MHFVILDCELIFREALYVKILFQLDSGCVPWEGDPNCRVQ